MTHRKQLRGEDGAAAVEFALVAALLFVLLFGIMEFGLAFFQLQNLRSATREGARAAAIGADADEVSDALVAGASGSLPSGYSGYTLSPSDGCDTPATELVQVTVPLASLPASVRSAFEVNIPFMPAISLTPEIRGSFRCET